MRTLCRQSNLSKATPHTRIAYNKGHNNVLYVESHVKIYSTGCVLSETATSSVDVSVFKNVRFSRSREDSLELSLFSSGRVFLKSFLFSNTKWK